MKKLNPQECLTLLTEMSRATGMYVGLGFSNEIVLSPINRTDKRHWPFYWDRERNIYRWEPETSLDEP